MTVNALIPISEDPSCIDYTMHENFEYVWVTVKNLAVCIKQDNDGIVVDILPNNLSNEPFVEPIAGTWALYNEAEEG